MCIRLIGVEFNLGSTKIKVLETPCHTSGHISYVAEATDDTSIPSVLFPGDTLFVGGCGRFFEGTAAQMLNNMVITSKSLRNLHTIHDMYHAYASR